MKQINNGYAAYYYLTEDGKLYNSDKDQYISMNNHCFMLYTEDKKRKKVSLKSLYRLVYNREYCEDNIKSLEGEQWKYIDYTNNIYMISNLGRIKSFFGYQAMLLNPYNTKKGYLRVDIVEDGQRKSKLLHRLVAAAFLPLPDKLDMQLHHKDFNKKNNAANNLEWLTAAEHAKKHSERNKEDGSTELEDSNSK